MGGADLAAAGAAAAPLLAGLAFGLALAMPVGPIGLLCIRRSLEDGFTVGFATGLGAALADAGYGAVAAFGLTAVSAFLLSWQSALALGGGALLLWLGLAAWRRPAAGAAETADRPAVRPLAAFAQTAVLTAANPQTVLTFVALFAGLGMAAAGDAGWLAAALLVAGVFLGSAGWWLLLAGGTATLLRGRLTGRHMLWINRCAGTLIAGFGVAAIARGLGIA